MNKTIDKLDNITNILSTDSNLELITDITKIVSTDVTKMKLDILRNAIIKVIEIRTRDFFMFNDSASVTTAEIETASNEDTLIKDLILILKITKDSKPLSKINITKSNISPVI